MVLLFITCCRRKYGKKLVTSSCVLRVFMMWMLIQPSTNFLKTLTLKYRRSFYPLLTLHELTCIVWFFKLKVTDIFAEILKIFCSRNSIVFIFCFSRVTSTKQCQASCVKLLDTSQGQVRQLK